MWDTLYIQTIIFQIGKNYILGFRILQEKLEKYWIYCHDIDRAWIPKPGNSTLKKTLRFSYDTLPSNGEIAKTKQKKEVQR